MTHLKNLPGILEEEALYSRSKICERAITITSIANQSVQKLRDRIYIYSNGSQQILSLHDYVPFYFATRTSMLRREHEIGLQEALLILEFDRRSLLREPGVLFTDGNASNQQLSRDRGECVVIEPVAALSGQCVRKYLPGGPYGTNESCSDFYSDPCFLDELNWYVINNKRSGLRDEKRQKQAEVLVPYSVSLKWIRRIVACTQRTAALACKMVDASKSGREYDIKVEIVKDMFF